MIKRSFPRNEADETELGMLENNRIAGLVPMELHEAGETVLCIYRDDSLSVLDSLMNPEAGNLYLYAVIYALASAGIELREHFLDENRLSLLPQEIFVDETAGKVLFLYDPVKKALFQESLQRLMEYFLKVINPAEEQRILFLYGLYRKSREEHVLPETLLQYWKEHAPEEKLPRREDSAVQQGMPAETTVSEYADGAPDEISYIEPGLYLPKNRAFEAWRKRRAAVRTEADEQDVLPTEPEEYENEPPRTGGFQESSISGRATPDESPSREKFRAFLIKYGYGLVIAAILLIGILLFFLI